MNSAFGVRMQVQTASDPDVFRTEPATLVQMSNGDLFFRPNSAAVASWSDITRVYGIQMASVDQSTTASDGSINHATSFRPDIFDIAFPCIAAETLVQTSSGLREAGALRRACRGSISSIAAMRSRTSISCLHGRGSGTEQALAATFITRPAVDALDEGMSQVGFPGAIWDQSAAGDDRKPEHAHVPWFMPEPSGQCQSVVHRPEPIPDRF